MYYIFVGEKALFSNSQVRWHYFLWILSQEVEQDTQFLLCLLVDCQYVRMYSHCCNSRDGWRMAYILLRLLFPRIPMDYIPVSGCERTRCRLVGTQVIPLPCCSSLSTDDRMIKHCTFRFEGLTWQLEQSKSWWREKIEREKMEKKTKDYYSHQ